ncbi:MAG: hypothetical protein P1P63_03480 [Treponemataceae bacterium]
MKKVNLLCIVGLVIFLFGTLFFAHGLVMLAAFFFSLIGYFDAKKKNQIGKIAALICMILSACIRLGELILLIKLYKN